MPSPTYHAKIDCLIAQHVFGWTNIHAYSGIKPDGVGPDGAVADIPKYSTDIAAAWPLAEKYRASILHDQRGWFVRLSTKSGVTFAPTAPLALCLATLKHLGIELPKEDAE